MTNKVVIFTGSKKDLDKFLQSRIDEDEETIPFMELIQHYNARLRPNESGVGEDKINEGVKKSIPI